MSLIETTAPVSAVTGQVPPRVWRQLLRNPLAVAAVAVLVVFIVVAALQPWILPHPPDRVDLRAANLPPLSDGHFLGGDSLGRDILSRLIASTRGALQAALVVATVATITGVTAGLIAGYYGRGFDSAAAWLFSVIMAIPALVVLVALFSLLSASNWLALTIYGVLVSPSMYWTVRVATRAVRNELYVDAARISGLSNRRIVGRHVLVAVRAPVLLMAAATAADGIAIQAGLSFLGLGDPSDASWGAMLSDAFGNMYVGPIQLLWPALALGLVMGAFMLISIGLRDALEGTHVRPSKRTRQRQRRAAIAQQPSSPPTAPPPGDAQNTALLSIQNLSVAYLNGPVATTVVNDVSLNVREGEIVGLVGESGSGKTQTVFAAQGLLPDAATITRGAIYVGGTPLLELPRESLRRLRGTAFSYVPQEPTPNLDPAFTIGAQLVYGIRAQTKMKRKEAKVLALSMLDRVGIRDAERVYRSYPHQISGGMAQRVLIAGAVASRPRLLIADEPTTALDVTTQAEVLDLIRDLQRERNMGVLIVTHNLGVVADLCDRVVVMRAGTVVEKGPVAELFANPKHEYTKALLASVLDNAPLREARAAEGDRARV